MSRNVAKSMLFSIGVHALFLVPCAMVLTAPMTDVVRGASSLEVDLISPSHESPRREERLAPVQPVAQVWLNDGGAMMGETRSTLRNPAPAYPSVARIRGWEGTVILRLFITPKGRPDAMQVARSSGYTVLDEAALAAVRQWQFVPARHHRAQVASLVEIPITFKLRNETEDS